MDTLDINPRIVTAVKKANLEGYSTILSLSAPDLQRSTQLSANDVKQLQMAAAKMVHVTKAPYITALDLQYQLTGRLKRHKLTTGCSVLDQFLRGGFLTQTLIEIAGQSASGKTQLCMQLCLTVQLPREHGGLEAGAVYICTEDVFPNKRLMQMAEQLRQRCSHAKFKAPEFTDNIFIEHAAEVEDLWYCITRKIPLLLAQARVQLVIIDSIAALFRCDYDRYSAHTRAKLMRKWASELLKLATKYNIPVVCVNQVSELMTEDVPSTSRRTVIPALGIAWANLVTMRLMLMRTTQTTANSQIDSQVEVPQTIAVPQSTSHANDACSSQTVVRTMEVLFAPHLPNALCHYIVDKDGVKGL